MHRNDLGIINLILFKTSFSWQIDSCDDSWVLNPELGILDFIKFSQRPRKAMFLLVLAHSGGKGSCGEQKVRM